MLWRREYLRKAAALAVASTWREDLPKSGLLGSIALHVYGLPVTDSMLATEKWRLWDYISLVELIGDGAEVIASVTGPVLRAMAFLDGGLACPDRAFNYGSSTHRFHTVLNLGRSLFDAGMGLDLSKWHNVEIRVTTDAAAAQYASGMSVDALLYFLEDAPSGAFSGYLRREVWRTYTTVQAAVEYLELPTLYPIRRIVLQVIPHIDSDKKAEATPYQTVSNIELLLDTGRVKVWDGSLRDLWYENAMSDGRQIIQALEPYHTSGKGIFTGLGQTLGMGGTRLMHGGAQSSYGTTMSPGEDSTTQVRLAATETDQDGLLALGLALENCAHFKFDHDPNPGMWLDPKVRGTVQLNLTTYDSAGAADGTVRAILERYVSR